MAIAGPEFSKDFHGTFEGKAKFEKKYDSHMEAVFLQYFEYSGLLTLILGNEARLLQNDSLLECCAL
jgi:hypothetical protein